jgi:hypothetical protein
MALGDSLLAFRTSVTEVRRYIAIAFEVDAAQNYVYDERQRSFITDSAFIRIFIAWESFLESAFLQYMTGAASMDGRAVLGYVTPIDISHANNMLTGTQQYVDWSTPSTVLKLCGHYFVNGNPFATFIGAIVSDLQDLKTIRNAAAHLSTNTQSRLDGLISRKKGQVVNNSSVSDLLFSFDPLAPGNVTFLDTYLTILDVAAEGISRA